MMKVLLAAVLCCAVALPAQAHILAGDVSGGLVAGFLHPMTGLDHLVAMVAVGLWGAQLGAPAIWLLPVAFPLVMAVGGLIGISGFDLPLPEAAIAASAIGLGLVVALRVRWPIWAACLLVSFFAIFHGYAHGKELPGSADPAAFAVGFVVATGLLHLVGITIGTVDRGAWGRGVVRGLGAGIAGLGALFLLAGVG